MPDTIHYSQCPACFSASIRSCLYARDYTVSHETFAIWQCDNCTLRFTQDAPAANAIGRYYQSENYVSHSDTQQGLINRLYHRVRNHTLVTKRKLVKNITGERSGNLLDVGAGTGAFSHTMQSAGWQVTALEPDDTARRVAFDKYQLRLLPPDELFRLPSERFDAISMWHVLEHVHDLHAYLEKFKSVLKTGGKLIIAVPNYTSFDAQKYGEYWAAYDVPRHLYHFSPKSMQMLGESKGFGLQSVHPMWFDSFYVSMLSEKYKNGSTGLISAGVTGFISNLKAVGDKTKCSSVIYIFSK